MGVGLDKEGVVGGGGMILEVALCCDGGRPCRGRSASQPPCLDAAAFPHSLTHSLTLTHAPSNQTTRPGVLACLDSFMNIAMEQTEEYVHGQLKAKYGDCFIRGNNGAPGLVAWFACVCLFKSGFGAWGRRVKGW